MTTQSNMELEKLLPSAKPAAHIPSPPAMRIHRRPAVEEIIQPAGRPTPAPSALPGVPSPQAQSWGTVVSVVIIVLMIIIGAFYAWGERIAQENARLTPSISK